MKVLVRGFGGGPFLAGYRKRSVFRKVAYIFAAFLFAVSNAIVLMTFRRLHVISTGGSGFHI